MNCISLGYFCSVSSELERYGLRDRSYPFDWLISDFSGVISAMEDGFQDLWKYDCWAQSVANRSFYKHLKYGFEFYHDFDEFRPLCEQLGEVRGKFDRRIRRFFSAIHEPTLFIRYISDEQQTDGVSDELRWIEENYDRIIKLLKSYNSENDILYIANNGVVSEKIKIYHVEKDKNDTVARYPFRKNAELNDYFSKLDHPAKEQNLKVYAKKARKKLISKIEKKLLSRIKRIYRKQYSARAGLLVRAY